ncbi:hypothetical protein PVAND_001165 [Polypedilum vanderplanki]|uniref:Pyrroline-5-carboxylate reductase n=1 Tax=Polypedilum vanderplanki TaxID=319348 RepID=A0A9J6BMI5_POLVA|nr:hypothetical protein PVAND_001165 [Polypedilum vanderplanki]
MTNRILKIGFLGAGKMAQALSKGFIKSGLLSSQHLIASAHPSDEASLKAFRDDLKAEAVTQNQLVVEKSEIIFISTKPNVVKTVLHDVKALSSGKLFISIAMGTTLDEIQKILAHDSRIIRVMPNIPATVLESCSVFVRGKNATDDDANIVQKLLKSIGTCEELTTESLMDVCTGLSGSGPAYVFLLIESLADGGVKCGLPRDLAYRLAAQTVLGSGKLVIDSNIHPAILKDNVMSPLGSTAYGVHYLEKNNFRNTIIGAVEAATNRCREISGISK